MFKTIINFFETSIAYLSIYDVFIILLFILAVVLSIISGIIIVSARVKKINVELTKNKNIQNINEKIIQNRLDFIINKLTNNQKNINNSNNIDNISNRNIKNVIDKTENKEYENIEANNTSNVIKLPSPKTLETIENNNEFNAVTESNENNENYNPTTSTSDDDKDINKNIVLTNNKIPDSSNYSEEKPILTVEPETITLNSEKAPINFFEKLQTDDKDDIIINIKDDSDKKITLVVNNEENENTNNDNLNINKDSNYEVSNDIPLNFNKDIETLTDNNDSVEDSKISYSETKNKEPVKDINLANYMLNKSQAFTNDEKFEIVNYINNNGNYINCLVNDKPISLNFKELNKQLIIQRLNYQYEYPLDLIETNYPIELNNKSIKKGDVVVFDENDYPYIICVLNIPEQEKCLNKLYNLVNSTKAPFGILVSIDKVQYYQNSDGTFEEIEDIVSFNESLDNNQVNISSNLKSVSHSKNSLRDDYHSNYYKQTSLNESNKQNNHDSFFKDKYNIYRKNPYSVSKEYQSIINKYQNLSVNYKNMHANLNNIHYNNTPVKQNNYNFSLSNNKFRDIYMNRYNNNMFPPRQQSHQIINNHMVPNNQYQKHYNYPNTYNYNNSPMNNNYTAPQPQVNINNNYPLRSFGPNYNNRMHYANNIPMQHNIPPMINTNHLNQPISQNNMPIKNNSNIHVIKDNNSNFGNFKSYKNLTSNSKIVKPNSTHLFNANFKLHK